MANILKRINWTNTLFLTITPLVAIIGTFLIGFYGHFHGATIGLALVLTLMTGLSITAGYHRLFSHRTYKASWPVRLVFLLVGAGAFEGSAVEWCTDHRRHHLYTDTEKDPYSIKQGFWHAHIGWLLFLDPSKRDYNNVKDLMNDPLMRFQHRFFPIIAIFMGFILPLAIASLWGDPWGGVIIAGALRIAFLQQMTFCINSVCHLFGKRTYSEEQSARDNWITALFTFGEGFHNFHHQFMFDYRNGIRFYDFDPSKWLIRGLAYLGLVKDLKRVSKKQLLQYRIRNEESLLLSKVQHYSEALKQSIEHFMHPLREKILKTAASIDQLEAYYSSGKVKAQLGNQLKEARLELRRLLAHWRQLMRNPELISSV